MVRWISPPSQRVRGTLAILVVIVAGSLPARADVKVTPGQEVLYSGTAEWKMTTQGQPPQAIAGPAKISALVTEADPAKGYAVILMQSFQSGRKTNWPADAPTADAAVGTVRFGTDLALAGPAQRPNGPMTLLLQAFHLPLMPRVELKAGQEWRQPEALFLMDGSSVEMLYTVAGDTSVGGRTCTRIEKKVAQPLPLRRDIVGGSTQLEDWGETICVDPASGQVVSDTMHQKAQASIGSSRLTQEFRAAVSLQETRQLSAGDVASRVKQAAALEHIWTTSVSGFGPNTDPRKALAQAAGEVTDFRREYPGSIYAPVLASLEASINRSRPEAEKEVRRRGLMGAPAPDFALKDLAGKKHTLVAYRGKIILLNFFANW